jgi:hypothetical protein
LATIVTRHFGGTDVVVPTWTRTGCWLATLTRNVCGPRLVGWFHRAMHDAVVAGGLCGVAVVCDVDVDVVVVVVVPGVAVAVVPVPAFATVVPFDTVAPAFVPLSPPKIKNAARKPTATARAATSQVFKPLRSIAPAR